ncbi:protein shisa-5-like [Carassius carassius]|uniref:protein shisa-5-like n=1 Tax=Carassius carassius TaxID=217509 RepID=UPI0028687BCA|nr:protein shisa-5-like [Carassius carassius]
MVFTSAVLLLLSVGLFTVTDGFFDDCESYFNSDNEYMPSENCGFMKHCCGSCDNRYCCYSESSRLSDYDQTMCTIDVNFMLFLMLVTSCFYLSSGRNIRTAIGLSIAGVVVFIVLLITCCCCPCCCIYQTCRKPRHKCLSVKEILEQKLKMYLSSGHSRCR